MEKIITFEKNAKEEILSLFDKAVDEEGYIVEKHEPTQRVLTPDGDEIELEKFAGVRQGSLLFFKSDINSTIELADSIKE